MRDDALPVRRIVLIGMAIACVVALAIGVVLSILWQRRLPVGGVAVQRPAQLAAGLPMLQTAPQQDLAAYRAEKSLALNGLGWVDAASGVAHVPIAVAMAVLAQRGAGSRPAPTSASASASVPMLPSAASLQGRVSVQARSSEVSP